MFPFQSFTDSGFSLIDTVESPSFFMQGIENFIRIGRLSNNEPPQA